MKPGEAKERPSADVEAILRGYNTYLVAECGLAAATVSAYRRDLAAFFASYPAFREVKLADVVAYVRALSAAGAKATSLNRRLSSLRVFYRYLRHEGVVTASPLEFLESPQLPQRLPDYLHIAEVEAIIEVALRARDAAEAAGAPPRVRIAAARDAAMLALAYACGLRASELVGLKRTDLDSGLGVVRVRGKGGKERLVPFGAVAREALDSYSAVRGPAAAESAYLFSSARRAGPVSRQLLWRRVTYYASVAKVPGVKPHLLRHTFASHLVQAGADVRTVQELLGHASVATTQIYAHLDTRALTAFHAKYHPRK